MWIIYAFASAFFAGIMSVLAKIGVRQVDSNLTTALRTIVVAVFAWLMVLITGSLNTITAIDAKSLTFLILSGFATGGSWLCYFKALQTGDVSKVVPIDKSSTVLTMLLSCIFLSEALTTVKVISMVLIGIGTYFMIEKKDIETTSVKGYKWLIYAFLSAVFASLTSILGKVGVAGINSNLGTAIRTLVVLFMSWLIVLLQGKHREIRQINKKSWVFIGFSGLATGLSWMCYYRALQDGPASVVVPIDKLSILVTVIFGYFVLHEKLKIQSFFGLLLLFFGTLILLL